jgi:hypothetical protein
LPTSRSGIPGLTGGNSLLGADEGEGDIIGNGHLRLLSRPPALFSLLPRFAGRRIRPRAKPDDTASLRRSTLAGKSNQRRTQCRADIASAQGNGLVDFSLQSFCTIHLGRIRRCWIIHRRGLAVGRLRQLHAPGLNDLMRDAWADSMSAFCTPIYPILRSPLL